MHRTDYVCPNCGKSGVKYRGSNEVATDGHPLPGTDVFLIVVAIVFAMILFKAINDIF